MKKHIFASLLLMPMAIASAYADDVSSVTVSGFGSAAVTKTSTNEAEFTRNNQTAGATRDATMGVDSNFGLQATDKVNDWLSFTGQAVERKDTVNRFRPEITWAFAKFKVSKDLSVRVGRLGSPIYLASDYINVGFASPMLRMPQEVYTQDPLETINGADLIYRKQLGDTLVTTQLAFGDSRRASNYGGVVRGHRSSVFNISAANGPLMVRFARSQANLTWTGVEGIDELVGALNDVGYTDLASRLEVKNKKGVYTTLGATLDWNNIVVQSEVAKRTTNSWISNTTAGYVMAGYRMGKLLPYVTYAKLNQNSPKSDSTVPADDPDLAPLAVGVNTVLNNYEQTTTSMGMRYDFEDKMALKVQIDRVKPRSDGGLLQRDLPTFNRPVTVVAASIDFVF